jgi:hypothetical protein
VTHGASDVSRRVRGDIHELVKLSAPGGMENLKLVEEDHPKPRPGETTTQKVTKTQIKIGKQKQHGYRK